MNKIKILTIIGARPQFIKAAAVSQYFSTVDEIDEVLVHTGQHFDENMSDVFFSELEIPYPKYKLNIASLSHGAMTGRMLEEIEEIVKKEKPDYVMVYGDTNSTLAGALAAKKLHVKVIHIEAGLRSFNNRMPEEINRILTDRISDIMFCPSTTSKKQLSDEGMDTNVFISGDVMFDAVKLFKKHMKPVLSEQKSKYVLATIHRAENTDDAVILAEIIEALNEINKTSRVLMPIHPRTRAAIKRNDIPVEFKLLDPVGYLEMLSLIDGADLVITDSGGLQKEAYFMKKNCLVVREETEWVELVLKGYNKIVGTSKKEIINSVKNSLNPIEDLDIYGSGNASEKISNIIIKDHYFE